MSDIVMDAGAVESLLEEPAILGMLETGGYAVRARAQELVRVRTGKLRDSIRVDLGFDEEGPYASIGSYENYALWQEIGTRKLLQTGGFTSYLRPALAAATLGLNVASLRDSAAGAIPTGQP